MYLTYLVPHLHVNRPLIELNQCIEPCVSCFFFLFFVFLTYCVKYNCVKIFIMNRY